MFIKICFVKADKKFISEFTKVNEIKFCSLTQRKQIFMYVPKVVLIVQ